VSFECCVELQLSPAACNASSWYVAGCTSSQLAQIRWRSAFVGQHNVGLQFTAMLCTLSLVLAAQFLILCACRSVCVARGDTLMRFCTPLTVWLSNLCWLNVGLHVMERIHWKTAFAAAAASSMLCLCSWPVAGMPHTNMDIDGLGSAGLHPATPDQRVASWSCSSARGAAAACWAYWLCWADSSTACASCSTTGNQCRFLEIHVQAIPLTKSSSSSSFSLSDPQAFQGICCSSCAAAEDLRIHGAYVCMLEHSIVVDKPQHTLEHFQSNDKT
jgi:hypothetical protein